MIEPFTTYTNGSNNYQIIDVITDDYPYPQVLPPRCAPPCVVFQNIRTLHKGFLPMDFFIQKVEAGELIPVAE